MGMGAVDLETPVTQQPRVPAPRFSAAVRLLTLFQQRTFLAAGAATVALLVAVVVFTSRPRFTAAPSPVQFTGTVRPLPAEPGQPIALVFSALGPQSAQPNPSSSALERYSYGTDLEIDAQNGLIYAITLAVPNRSWRGLQIGMNEVAAEGTLALLGFPRQLEPVAGAVADTIGGYVTYRTLDARPRKAMMTEVRPPNGCYDVTVELQPRAAGVLRAGSLSLVALAPVEQPFEWVVTRIRVVSRAAPGPYAAGVAC
jgi:hypothetical protein